MRAVVQRVREAWVTVGEEETGRIGSGLLVFLGVGREDGPDDVRYLADKIVNLRIFADSEDKMNLSLRNLAGGMLVVSQFTLWGDCRKGRRPSFVGAAPPEDAVPLYEDFVRAVAGYGIKVGTGRFQEMMDVHLVNDGPVTLLLDSRKAF